ncbi:asparagine synthase (glutamine-hydrolysing) [Fluviicoccus keumensis]|uniref:asparagine synthase (glutamine-hydrolyzing) n=1 Tax=Fluviicoccus keumensis TaxID=1435465 RepID=A0A4V2G644_9GAMM|nr:asparagine synthase (glutamine-hydrolyzing) [Fluviicoccus keumensis]RZU47276.1 asparagine synthase (glutamine-hydrolysing) [Fluviicoccus keumensis]
MCGIFGYFDAGKRPLEEGLLQRMGESLHHRGPDDRGIFHEPGVGLGNQRLSIIDVAHGHQPFVSDDGQVVVVQNGEIFNHVELAAGLAGTPFACRTHSDTEVILRLYEQQGIGFLSQLNGMFAIAIWDARRQTLYLARDRVGVKPLFVAEDDGRTFFASEIKSILAAGWPAEQDDRALDLFFSFNFVPPPHTAFKGVRHVMPGHYLEITSSEIRDHVWWDLARMSPEERPESEWMSEFLTILDDAVRLRLRSDVPVGAFLSGGVDSSTITGLMARHLDYPLQTFCIGFDDPRFDESPFAEAAAQRFGTTHLSRRVDADMLDMWPQVLYYCDQPHGDVSFMPTYRVAELAASRLKVVLTGDGGDELFAGYDKYRQFFARESAFTAPEAEFRQDYLKAIGLLTLPQKQAVYGPRLTPMLSVDHAREVVDPLLGRVGHWDRINQALYLDMMLLLPGNNLVKPDRMGMAVSLEARTPFLDYRMVEFAFRMPGRLKLKDGETKYLFKKAVRELIGDDLAYRKKQMFTVPVGEWFKSSRKAWLQSAVDTGFGGSWADRDGLRRMVDAHVSGEANHTREIRALMAVDLWRQRFGIGA